LTYLFFYDNFIFLQNCHKINIKKKDVYSEMHIKEICPFCKDLNLFIKQTKNAAILTMKCKNCEIYSLFRREYLEQFIKSTFDIIRVKKKLINTSLLKMM